MQKTGNLSQNSKLRGLAYLQLLNANTFAETRLAQ